MMNMLMTYFVFQLESAHKKNKYEVPVLVKDLSRAEADHY